MDSDVDNITGTVLALSVGVLLHAVNPPPKKKRKKRIWVRPFIRHREDHGAHAQLVPLLREDDAHVYLNFLRVPERLFLVLLRLTTPFILKKTTKWRAPLSPSERLTITLRFLATGDSYRSLDYLFYVGASIVGQLVSETCQVIYDQVGALYFKFPDNKEKWKEIADSFWTRWQFPHILGALDGKHIRIKCPNRSGCNYYNYKGHFSIVLMAMCDAHYRYTFIDVGGQGRISDGGIFGGTGLDKAMRRGSSMFPTEDPLPGEERSVSYFLIGDDAFSLQENMMKPYSHRHLTLEQDIFNYRLSRARRVIENSFGITCSRFRVLLTTMNLSVKNAVTVMQACCVLHNLRRTEVPTDRFITMDEEDLTSGRIENGSWRTDPILSKLLTPISNNPTLRAKELRDYLCAYVNSDVSSVSWQLMAVRNKE